jgi:hypothetical protein
MALKKLKNFNFLDPTPGRRMGMQIAHGERFLLHRNMPNSEVCLWSGNTTVPELPHDT